MESGLIHIYCGDGKGKTTAAVGLALRCAGAGGMVLICQFLKDGSSGEIGLLEKTENITVMPAPENVKFSFKMSGEEKTAAAAYYTKRFDAAVKAAQGYDMLVFDEILYAVDSGFVPLENVLLFLKNKPAAAEVVMTGRAPAPELCAAADYITEMKKIKHPFDRGIKARKRIEF